MHSQGGGVYAGYSNVSMSTGVVVSNNEAVRANHERIFIILLYRLSLKRNFDLDIFLLSSLCLEIPPHPSLPALPFILTCTSLHRYHLSPALFYRRR